MGCAIMIKCKVCDEIKNEAEFSRHRFGYSSTCKNCTDLIKKNITGGKVFTTRRKHKGERLEKPAGSIHKRCPSCKAHVYVVQTEENFKCWKCGTEYRIVKAIRDSTLHRGGVILRSLEWF